MPVSGKVLHIDKCKDPVSHSLFSYDLSHVDILDLVEGDYVLLRKNSSGFYSMRKLMELRIKKKMAS